MRFDQWLKQAVERLRAGESPKRDAEILLGFVAGKSRSSILAFGETELTPEQVQQLELLLARRERGEPVAYLLGEREFWSLPLEVSPATLIPRPDTECLVEKALALLPVAACSVLDLGTGTGAIALALASERPDCQFVGVDYSADATALASRNASRLNITNVTFVTGSWYDPVGAQQFALIASNPPYIDESDPHLSQGMSVLSLPVRWLHRKMASLICAILWNMPPIILLRGMAYHGAWLAARRGCAPVA